MSFIVFIIWINSNSHTAVSLSTAMATGQGGCLWRGLWVRDTLERSWWKVQSLTVWFDLTRPAYFLFRIHLGCGYTQCAGSLLDSAVYWLLILRITHATDAMAVVHCYCVLNECHVCCASHWRQANLQSSKNRNPSIDHETLGLNNTTARYYFPATGYDFLAPSVQKQKCIISHCKLWFAEWIVLLFWQTFISGNPVIPEHNMLGFFLKSKIA